MTINHPFRGLFSVAKGLRTLAWCGQCLYSELMENGWRFFYFRPGPIPEPLLRSLLNAKTRLPD